MTGGGEAAEQMVRMMLSGTEVAVRLGGSALKNLLALTLALAKSHKKISGRVNMTRMLRETRDLRTIPMTPEQYDAFRRLAQRQRILFSAIRDRDDRGALIDVVMPTQEVARANPILERILHPEAERQPPAPAPECSTPEQEQERNEQEPEHSPEHNPEPVPEQGNSRSEQPAERSEQTPDPSEQPPSGSEPVPPHSAQEEPSKKDAPSSRDSPGTAHSSNSSNGRERGGTTRKRVSVEARLKGYRAQLQKSRVPMPVKVKGKDAR